jgi:hypothetical protein
LPRDFCRLLGLGCPKQAFAKIVARLWFLGGITTRAVARTDIFDYIVRFDNQRKQRFLNSDKINQNTLN